jgi:hypothetical protein
MELALPILEKVHNKTLCLYDFNLSEVQTKALQNAASFFESFVNRVLFDNCGITDEQFAGILAACWDLKDFKSIVYRHNEFGMKSAEAILNLTTRRKPYQLEELRINHCKTTPKVVTYLLRELVSVSYISKLSLVDANLGTEGMSLIC